MNFLEENIFEKKLDKRIDEKKLNSLKATTIVFLFFSTVAIILFILYYYYMFVKYKRSVLNKSTL
ncbi:MAG: hypothetical protein K2J98_00535, partial [Malacoplasma sp.]|nr:hypothetical protein [Malacoplasma sp.]